MVELVEPSLPDCQPGWTARHTGLLFAVLVSVVALVWGIGGAMSPPPPGDRLMLDALPEPAWTTQLAEGESAEGVGVDLIVIRERRLGAAGAAVRGIEAATGEVLWRHVVRGNGRVNVRDLPGTVWIAVQVGSEVTLLDRLTGETHKRFRLPEGEWGPSWFGSGDKGSFVMIVPMYADAGRVLSVTRLAAPDPTAVVWTREVPLAPAVAVALRDPEVIERDGLLLLRAAGQQRGTLWYATALRSDDGGRQAWADGDRFAVAGDAAVSARRGRLKGYDLRTGRRLWQLKPAPGLVFGSGGVLLVQAAGELRRVNPYSGRTQWVARMDGLYTRMAVDDDQLIVYQGAQTIFPDRGTTTADAGSNLVRALDLATGREVWRVATPSPVLDVIVGTNHLVVRMYNPHERRPAFEVAAVRLDGTISWLWRDDADSWSLTRLGRHLATIGPDGELTVWG